MSQDFPGDPAKADAARDRLAEGRARDAEGIAAALDALGDALLSVDVQGGVLRMNGAAERMCGCASAQARGKPVGEVLLLRAEGSDRAVQVPLARLLATAGPIAPGVDLLVSRPDGGVCPATGSGAPLREGDQIAGVLLVLRDVTSERAALERERRRQHELLDLLDGLPDGIAIYRGETIAYVNGSLAEMIGRPREQLFHRRLEEFLTVEREEPLRKLPDGSPAPKTSSDIFRVRRDDEARLVEVGRSQAVEFEGSPGSLLLLRDVTVRENLRLELHEKSRLASVGTLAAGVAHEINNPLTYVLANARFAVDLVEGGGVAGERLQPLREALAELFSGAQRAADIVSDLSRFVRPEGAEGGPFELGPVVEMALRMTRAELKGRARASARLGPVPLVAGSRARVGQLCVNLLVNAAQAIAPGDEASNLVEVEVDQDERGWARLRVRDTGCGMTPEVRTRVFEPFFTTRPVGEGAGLGLSVAHNVAASMGGQIAVESEPGKGSCFTVVLPPAPG